MYSAFGSAIEVDIDAEFATGTDGVGGFERVIGSTLADEPDSLRLKK